MQIIRGYVSYLKGVAIHNLSKFHAQWAFTNTEVEFRFPQNVENFLPTWSWRRCVSFCL